MKSSVSFSSIYPLFALLTACQHSESCEVYKRRFNKLEADVIVKDKGPDGRVCFLKGIHPVTHKPVFFYDEGGFYIAVKDLIDVGDTLVKVKGNAIFLIKKVRSNVELDYPCGDGSNHDIYYKPIISKK